MAKKGQSKKSSKFYVTTTIPYANALPHIGFAFELIGADIVARWHRLIGEDVFFLTGTDEHGSNIYRMSKENGLTPKQFVDKNSSYFRDLTDSLNISNSKFIRTTDKKNHWPGALKIWSLLEKKGDLYKKKYEGNYCNGCERFVTEKDIVDGKCPNHPTLNLEFISEENYFFKLSKYSEKIIKLIKTDALKIYPQKYKNDFISLIKDGLNDVSFSRDKKHLPWGIPVPGNENQVFYVWADALPNYLTGIGYPDDKYKKYWPADLHVVGKDMLRFHTGIWPGILLSAGLELPKKVIVHGFLTVDGEKMSKSKGNVVNPLELRKKYSADTIRYYLMRTIPFGDDGDFSEQALKDRYNNELANKLGNLVARVNGLIGKGGGKITESNVDPGLADKLNLKQIKESMDSLQLDKALNEVFSFIEACNEYAQQKQPWTLEGEERDKVLYTLADSIRITSILLFPFLPDASERINSQFGFPKPEMKNCEFGLTKSGKIEKGEILFKKIE